MSSKRAMAVDLGASGGKCFLGTFEGKSFQMEELHRFSHEGVPFFLDDRTGTVTERTYWNDTGIYENILEGLRAYRRDVGDTLDSIGIDTWGADGQFLDPDGESLGKMYAYRDHRLDNMVDVVKSRIDPARVYEITGIHFQFFNISGQLHWFVKNRPQLQIEGSRFFPVPSLFAYYLSGEHKVDSTWASVTQLVDAAAGDWSDELLKALEIPREVLPPIVPAGTMLGRMREPLADHLGLNRVPVAAVGAHDTACAFAAAPVDDADSSLIISSGTWSLVGKLLPRPITSRRAMECNLSNEGGIGNTRFLKNCMGTWLVQELRRAWRIDDGKETEWPELHRLTREATPFRAFLDPDHEGFVNPSNMQRAIDEYCESTGQEKPASRGEYMRSIYESLALKYRTVSEQICEVSGTTNEVVHIVGGGCKNELLNQFTADALGLRVLAGPDEATAVGNLMTQALAMGLIGEMRDAQPLIRSRFPIREYAPQDTATWSEAYDRFRTIAAGS